MYVKDTADLKFYEEALKEAEQGLLDGGIPIGSILVHQGKISNHRQSRGYKI